MIDMIKRKKIPKVFGEITLSILDIICSIPLDLVDSFVDQKRILKQMESSKMYKSLPINYINDMIHRGYLETNNVNGAKSIRLTNKGKIRRLESNRDFICDKKWRFLSFDIPENRSRDRNHFRRSIKRIGFRQVQKSLWVCPYAKADQIDLIIEELKIRSYVCYILAETTDIEKHLEALFRKRVN